MKINCHLSVINLYQCEQSFSTPKRTFDYHYLLYVHKGIGKYKIDNITYDAKIGDIFYCPPQKSNTIFADANNPFLLSGLEFTADQSDYLAQNISSKINISKHTFLITGINEMIEEYRFNKTFSSEICDNILSILVSRLIRISQGKTAGSEDISESLLQYIMNNYDKEITHNLLSEIFSYHKNSINRILLKSTNMTLKNYIIDIRMKKACEFLLYSNKTVAEIAELCGYSSSVFFSRQFKQKNGITPLEYRKNTKLS